MRFFDHVRTNAIYEKTGFGLITLNNLHEITRFLMVAVQEVGQALSQTFKLLRRSWLTQVTVAFPAAVADQGNHAPSLLPRR
jgi:hypothetical protein